MNHGIRAGLAILVAIGATLWVLAAVTGPAERLGDRIQIALPLMAGACAATKGALAEQVGRFAGSMVVVHGLKNGLGDAPLNQRPNGRDRGFPSGHTAAAAFGASYLVRECATLLPYAGPAAVLAAGFVGGSRLDANRHDLPQVMAGAVVGIGFDIGFRSAQSRRVLGRAVASGMLAGRRLIASGRRRTRRLAMVLVAGIVGMLMLAGQGHAQDHVFSVYGGVQGASSGDVKGRDIDESRLSFDVDWEGRSGDMPPYWGVRYAYRHSDAWAVTADFNHAKLYADERSLARAGFGRLEFTDGLNVLTVGVERRFAPVHGVRPYLGAGVGIAYPHVETRSPAARRETRGYQFGGPAAEIRAGAEYALSRRWAVFAEAEGNYVRLDVDMDGGGSLRSDVFTYAVNFGISLRPWGGR